VTPLLLDIGTGELVVLIVLAVILLGPEKAPGLAKKAARVLRFLRHVANNATEQVKAELGPEFSDWTVSDLKPKNLVQRALPADARSEMDALRAEMDNMRTEVARLRLQTGGDLRAISSAAALPPIAAGATAQAGQPESPENHPVSESDRPGAPVNSGVATPPAGPTPPQAETPWSVVETAGGTPSTTIETDSSANAASDSAADTGSSSSTAKPFWIRT